MTKEEADILIGAIRSLLEPLDAGAGGTKHVGGGRGGGKTAALEQAAPGKALTLERKQLEGTDNVGGFSKPFALPELEELYQSIKRRLIEDCAIDPTLLHLLTQRPEILVDIERNEINLDGSTLKGRIARVAAEGFLGSPRKAVEVAKAMERTGATVNTGDLSRALKDMQKLGLLTLDDGLWQLAPGVKITERSMANR